MLIEYDCLNLPSEIIFENGHKIFNIYVADGQKLESMYITQSTLTYDPLEMTLQDENSISEIHGTYYFENIEYEYGNLEERNRPFLKRIHNTEGYVSDNKYFYYRRDHLGNNREVWNATQNRTEQITSYYPSGMPWAYETAQVQPYLYNGKEFVEIGGLDEYDSQFRYYYPALVRTNTPDPHAENYYSVSPYSWCANRFIRWIDPDGRDVWEINRTGEIINRIKDETQDAFYMVAKDADGNYQRTFTTDAEGNKTYNSISFKYGTIESQKSITYSPDGQNTAIYDVYQVRGDNNGTALFEFMGENVTGSSSMVEIGQAKTGIEGNKGLNFITTSHEAKQERGIGLLLNSQLYYGYTIRELNHTHPIGDNASETDILSKANVLSNLEIARKYGYQKWQIPSFSIYHIPSKSYIKY